MKVSDPFKISKQKLEIYKLSRISVRISDSLLKEIEESGLTITEVVRIALRKYLRTKQNPDK